MGTRHPFGGSIADYAVTDGGGGAVTLAPGVPVLFYTAPIGGSQITDLTSDQAGTNPTTGTVTGDGTGGTASGQILTVYGPEDVLGMWASAAGGTRVFVLAQDAATVLASALTAVATVTGNLSAHASDANAHGTAFPDLADSDASARANGYFIGWDSTAGRNVYLPPSVASGAVLLNPPLSGGVYVGNLITAPTGTGSGNPWFDTRLPYSASDNNPDFFQVHAYWSDLTTRLKTFWLNGNGEVRSAPSTPSRIGARFFESYEGTPGLSTGLFATFSTNPSNTANREALLGVYGSASSTKPGWTESTRVLSALLGLAAGGNYNSLGQLIFRGRRSSTGAPSSGTWAAWDVVVDSAGALWMCTVAGTPGTWVGGGGGSGNVSGSWSDVTPGTSVAHGTVHGSVRLDNTGDSASPVRMRGSLTISGTITSGTTVFTVPSGFRPTWDSVIMIRNTGSSTNLVMTVATTGAVTFGSGLSSGMVLIFDGITWTLA
jgi:hypothetical protein